MLLSLQYVVVATKLEDTVHALWECQRIKYVWWEDKFCQTSLFEHFVDFRDLFVGVLNSNDPELADRFAMVGWSIWCKRNADRTVQGSLPYD